MKTKSFQNNLPIIFENKKLRALGVKKNDSFIQLRKNSVNSKLFLNKGIQSNLLNTNLSQQTLSVRKRNNSPNDSESTVDISSFYTFKTKRNYKLNFNNIKNLSQDRKEKEKQEKEKKKEDKIVSSKHLLLTRNKSQVYFSVFKDLKKDNLKKERYINNKFNLRYAENENYYARIINKVNKMRNESYFIINHDLDKDKYTERRHERLKETKQKLKFIKNVLDYAFDSLLQKKLNVLKRNNYNEIKKNNSCRNFNY